MGLKLAKRYAQSLFELLVDDTKIAKAIADLEAFLKDLLRYPKVKDFMMNDYVSIAAKLEVLESFSKSVKLDKMLHNFLALLTKNRRIKHLAEIVRYLQKLHDEATGVMPVDVVVAGEIDKSCMKSIEKALKSEFNKSINANIIVDKSIIGGLQFKTDGLLYDASIMTALKNLKKSI